MVMPAGGRTMGAVLTTMFVVFVVSMRSMSVSCVRLIHVRGPLVAYVQK